MLSGFPNNALTFQVHGIPTPQGSKRGIPIRRKNGKTGVALIESAGERLTTWREDIRAAAITAAQQGGWTTPPRDTPIEASIRLYLPRPKSHYRTGKNAHLLRPTAPHRPTTKPDIDKLVRAILDALTSANIYPDDSQVVDLHTSKKYADTLNPPGALILLCATHTTQGPTP